MTKAIFGKLGCHLFIDSGGDSFWLWPNRMEMFSNRALASATLYHKP